MTTPRVICVLGMHRSGTSCLTGSLQASGLYLGRHHTWNKYNQKGNRENQDFVDFHDRLLADSGGSWDQPPAKMLITPQHLTEAAELVSAFRKHEPWGFKDPRALLALPVWDQVLPQAHYIGIFRHPLAVRDSLQQRDPRMTDETCLSLWHTYNEKLYRHHQRRSCPMLCFDWAEEVFHNRLDQVLQDLALQPLDPSDRFFSAELRNFTPGDHAGLPWKVRRLYRKLRRIADRG